MSVASWVRDRWKSWLLTGCVALVFALMLKPDAPVTLAFFGLPPLFSQSTWNVIIVALALVGLLVYMRKVGLDVFGGCAVGFVAIIFLSTMYNNGDLALWATQLLPCLFAVLIVAALAREYGRNLLQGMFIAASFYLVCNLVFLLRQSEIISFNAMDDLFTGYRNGTFHTAIPAFGCSILLDARSGKRFSIRSLTVYLLALFEMIVGYSATSVCAFAFLGFIVFLVQFRRVRSLLNGAVLASTYIALFMGLVILRVQDGLGFFIEGVLGRSLTFTGRTAIWDRALELLTGNALVAGYGMPYNLTVMTSGGERAFYAHNDFLHIGLLGGVGALAIIVVLIVLAARGLFLCRREIGAAYVSAILFAFAIIGLMESVLCVGAAFFLAVAYYENANADSVEIYEAACGNLCSAEDETLR